MITFDIPDISCDHCKTSVANALHSVDAHAVLEFDMAARQVSVQSTAAVDAMQAALVSAGYPATIA